jgi:hypothetical protein
MQYEEPQMEDYAFGPLSISEDKYLKLESEEKMVFIDEESQLMGLDILLIKDKLLAVDCKWTPGFLKHAKVEPTILQFGDEDKVFIVDLLKLNESSTLNTILGNLFTQRKVVGM